MLPSVFRKYGRWRGCVGVVLACTAGTGGGDGKVKKL
jgi:hypothetical protein